LLQSLPVSVAFCGIMYTAAVYRPYVPAMARLLIGSNSLHQLVMTCLSSLPFVVGQVQDIGLIFIHAETQDISNRMKGEPAERIMGTAMLASMLSNIMLGLCFILVGKYAPSASPHLDPAVCRSRCVHTKTVLALSHLLQFGLDACSMQAEAGRLCFLHVRLHAHACK
jgi:hypothetical protein